MKTFNELQEGDKIFFWTDKPHLGDSKKVNLDHYSHYGEYIPSVFNIDKVQNCGFCRRFLLNTIIGNKFMIGYTEANELIINVTRSTPYVKREIWWRNNCTYVQNLFITTSEEEWLEKINEDI